MLAPWTSSASRVSSPSRPSVDSQFEGYERLDELEWGEYRERYGDIQRLDRILEAEDDTPTATRPPSRRTCGDVGDHRVQQPDARARDHESAEQRRPPIARVTDASAISSSL